MQISISMLSGVTVTREEGQVIIEALPRMRRPRLVFKQVTPTVASILERIQKEYAPLNVLTSEVMKNDGMMGIMKWNHYLQKLGQDALVSYSMSVNDKPFISFEPLTTHATFDHNKVKKDEFYTVSKFAYCHKEPSGMVINSPLAYSRVCIQNPTALAAFYELQDALTMHQLMERVPELDEAAAITFMNFLANSGIIVKTEEGNKSPESKDPVLGQWAFHDLLFQTSNRMGRHSDPYGGTYPFKDIFKPVPLVKPHMSENIIPLYKPDLEKLKNDDTTFTAVLEKRQSIRKYGEPMTVEQLGEFLYRAARIKKMSLDAMVSARPSPGGGAIHSLEIYPVVNRCEGLEKGLYHYNPQEHHLEKVETDPYVLQTLIELSGVTGKLEGETPQVILVLASRFQRVQIKYQSVAYSVILKDVGCLYQTMYLVATAMGLAPCALGGGDSDLFAQLSGNNYYAETSVGEFLLGRAPETLPRWGE